MPLGRGRGSLAVLTRLAATCGIAQPHLARVGDYMAVSTNWGSCEGDFGLL